jgi:hypothetical protein
MRAFSFLRHQQRKRAVISTGQLPNMRHGSIDPTTRDTCLPQPRCVNFASDNTVVADWIRSTQRRSKRCTKTPNFRDFDSTHDTRRRSSYKGPRTTLAHTCMQHRTTFAQDSAGSEKTAVERTQRGVAFHFPAAAAATVGSVGFRCADASADAFSSQS